MSPPPIVVSTAELRELESRTALLIWAKFGDGRPVRQVGCEGLARRILRDCGFRRASLAGDMRRQIVDATGVPEHYLRVDDQPSLPRPFDQARDA